MYRSLPALLLVACVKTTTPTGPPVTPPPDPIPPSCGEDTWLSQGGWPGEWPSPVVEVRAMVNVPASGGPCVAMPDRTCTLAPGLYHPWANTPDVVFASIAHIQRWRATMEFYPWSGDDATKLPADTVVEVLGYLSEGYCELRIDGTAGEGRCPDPSGFEELNQGTQGETRLVFRAPCGQGSPAWIQVDDALMSNPGITEGTFGEYGTVLPSSSP